MNVPEFEYVRATSLEQACALLSTHGGEAKILAGGTDILVKMKHQEACPLVSDRHQADIRAGLHPLRGGGRPPRRSPRQHRVDQALPGSAEEVSGATSGGGIHGHHRHPQPGHARRQHLQWLPVGRNGAGPDRLDAKARILGPGGERVVSVEDFFTGPGPPSWYLTKLVAELWVPEPPAGAGGAYQKHSLRRMDVAMVGVAALVVPDGETCGDVRIVLSAVAPTPMRARRAEGVLRGQVPTEALLEAAAREAAGESRPITDIRGSAESRKTIVETLTGQVIRQALRAAKLGVR